MIKGRALDELLRLELEQSPTSQEYALGVTPQRAAKPTAKAVTVVPRHVNGKPLGRYYC